jgi:hypothetical protein
MAQVGKTTTECWRVGVMECWSTEVLECWSFGLRLGESDG